MEAQVVYKGRVVVFGTAPCICQRTIYMSCRSRRYKSYREALLSPLQLIAIDSVGLSKYFLFRFHAFRPSSLFAYRTVLIMALSNNHLRCQGQDIWILHILVSILALSVADMTLAAIWGYTAGKADSFPDSTYYQSRTAL